MFPRVRLTMFRDVFDCTTVGVPPASSVKGPVILE